MCRSRNQSPGRSEARPRGPDATRRRRTRNAPWPGRSLRTSPSSDATSKPGVAQLRRQGRRTDADLGAGVAGNHDQRVEPGTGRSHHPFQGMSWIRGVERVSEQARARDRSPAGTPSRGCRPRRASVVDRQENAIATSTVPCRCSGWPAPAARVVPPPVLKVCPAVAELAGQAREPCLEVIDHLATGRQPQIQQSVVRLEKAG